MFLRRGWTRGASRELSLDKLPTHTPASVPDPCAPDSLSPSYPPQVRRMVEEFLKLTVVELRRVRIGPISLGALPQGKWRFLSDREGEEMMHLVGTTGDERRESIEGARMAENAGFAGLKRSK